MKTPTSHPLLSVLVVAYKSRGEIPACLESIPRDLCGRPVEVIVVDNASGDDLGSLVKLDFPWVQYIQLEANLGFGRANNVAYERARGEFILFLNPDTISNEVAYLHCLNRLKADRTIGIISPKLVLLDGSMDLACRRSIPTIWDGFCRATGLATRFPKSRLFGGYNLTYLPEGGTYEVGAVNGAFMMSPRKALLRFGVFDEQFFMYGDDLDLCYRCRKAGYKVVYDGRVKMVHLKGVSSSKDSRKMARALFSATQQFYLKHFNPGGLVLINWKYRLLFGAWERLARVRATTNGHNKVRPL